MMSIAQDSHSLRQLAALSRVMNLGVLLLDDNADPEFANPIACDLIGCASEAELNERWPALKPLLHLDTELPLDATPRRIKIHLPLPGASRLLRLEVSCLEEDSCTGYLVLLKDGQIEDALVTDLLLAGQMRAQAYLNSALVHDVRAPMNTMQLTLELLASMMNRGPVEGDASKQQRHIEVLRNELTRLNRTLQTLLDHGAPLSPAIQEFDLRMVVEEVASLIGPQAKRQTVKLQIRLPERPAKVQGHRDRLKQAFTNVVLHALEAMPKGGLLEIDMHLLDATVVIKVKHEGQGIADELREEIYQIGLTAKTSGNDLGLHAVRVVMDAHGGDIEVENLPIKGACFTLSLPLATASATQ